MKPVRGEQSTARILEEFQSATLPVAKVRAVSGMLPVMFLRGGPPSPYFSQVFILKAVKVLCFDTLLQVFILKVVTGRLLDSSNCPTIAFITGRPILQMSVA